MEKFLVTGGAGFIGSNICKELISQGCFVRVVDNLLTGKKSNLASIIDKIDFIPADMGDAEVAQSATKDIDVVLHQGHCRRSRAASMTLLLRTNTASMRPLHFF